MNFIWNVFLLVSFGKSPVRHTSTSHWFSFCPVVVLKKKEIFIQEARFIKSTSSAAFVIIPLKFDLFLLIFLWISSLSWVDSDRLLPQLNIAANKVFVSKQFGENCQALFDETMPTTTQPNWASQVGDYCQNKNERVISTSQDGGHHMWLYKVAVFI